MATFDGDVEATAVAIERLLADDRLDDGLARWHGGRATTVIVGRGGGRATAEMAALTIEEAVGIPVMALQAAQFRHGPLELAGPATSVMIAATEPTTARLDRRLAEDLTALGSSVLLVGDADGDGGWIDLGPLHPTLAPAAGVVPSQILARRLAIRAGREPGAYVHAAKVTTRE